MNKLDILIFIIVGLPIVIGLSSGFLKNLLGFAGIIVGLIVASNFSDQIAGMFISMDLPGQISTAFSFTGVIIFFYVLGGFAAKRISRISSFTSTMDKLFGGIFGALQGLIIASLAIHFLKFFNFISVDTMQASMMYPMIAGIAPEIVDVTSKILPFVKVHIQGKKFFK